MPASHRVLSSHSALFDRCLLLSSLPSAESLHARLLKLGLLSRTFLANRLLSLYANLRAASHALPAFHETPGKNVFTHNILLGLLGRAGRMDDACGLFEEMPHRDVVSFNSMMSGYASLGLVDEAFRLLYRMRESGVTLSAFTYSIVASRVSSTERARELHGNAIRSAVDLSSTVLGNSFVNMYGRIGLMGHAWRTFGEMEHKDVISWNSIISACSGARHWDSALECFHSMREYGFLPNEFTLSTMIHVCADLQDLAKGEQLLDQCFKMGCLLNSIVSSALIYMYSKCGRLDDSVRLFHEVGRWDSALCNSMASAYARSGLIHEALRLFVLALKKDIRPTEYMFASILSSSSCFGLPEQGTQIHCLVFKLGLDGEIIVASALVDMYAKLGSIEPSMRIFSGMAVRDLVSWNAMIMGLAQNGQGVEALRIFRDMQENGHLPDRITLIGVLTACGHEGMVSEGKSIFSQMEEKYGIAPSLEDYACMVDMMGRAGKLGEAMEIIETMPHKPDAMIWELLLEACRVHADVRFAEIVAERVMELKPRTSLPYFILARRHETRGKWESMVRTLMAMKERGVKKISGCSWIGIKDQISVFSSDQMLYCGREAIHTILHLLAWEMESEEHIPEKHEQFEDG